MNGEDQYLPMEEYGGSPPPAYQYVPPINDTMSESSLKYQLDPDEIIDVLRHTLLGHRKVRKNNKVEWVASKEGGDLNETGMDAIESELRLRLSKIFKLTKLDDEAISAITIGLFKNLLYSMRENYQVWGITKITSFSKIANMVCDSVYVTLKAAQNGEYLLFLKSTYNIMENRMTSARNNMPDRKPAGIAGNIFKGAFK